VLVAVFAAMALLVVVVVVQTLRGRMADRACCPADPAQDLRMRAAFADEPRSASDRVGGPDDQGVEIG
jgi:hypothetical protein